MDTLFEISKIVLPAIITGIFTFIITNYKLNRNAPLDKYEIAYNRIYYPLYNLIKDINTKKKNVNDIDIVIEKSKLYLKKYNKYADRSTLIAFEILKRSNTFAKKKRAFQNFKSNIYNKNFYLRRMLGYLEPNFLQMYKYSSDSEKSTFRILMEFCTLYSSLVFVSISKDNVQAFCLALSIVFIVILIVELICKFIMYLYYKIKK